MTEREKMQNRKLYDANDRSLCADRVRAKELCHAYNQLWPSDEAGKREILRRLLAKTGEDFCVTAPFWCDYGYNIRLGEHFYANHNLVILDCAAVTFGDHVFVAPNCGFYTAGHHKRDCRLIKPRFPSGAIRCKQALCHGREKTGVTIWSRRSAFLIWVGAQPVVT